eukprot:4945921-Amphidinium_carterae.1
MDPRPKEDSYLFVFYRKTPEKGNTFVKVISFFWKSAFLLQTGLLSGLGGERKSGVCSRRRQKSGVSLQNLQQKSGLQQHQMPLQQQ